MQRGLGEGVGVFVPPSPDVSAPGRSPRPPILPRPGRRVVDLDDWPRPTARLARPRGLPRIGSDVICDDGRSQGRAAPGGFRHPDAVGWARQLRAPGVQRAVTGLLDELSSAQPPASLRSRCRFAGAQVFAGARRRGTSIEALVPERVAGPAGAGSPRRTRSSGALFMPLTTIARCLLTRYRERRRRYASRRDSPSTGTRSPRPGSLTPEGRVRRRSAGRPRRRRPARSDDVAVPSGAGAVAAPLLPAGLRLADRGRRLSS